MILVFLSSSLKKSQSYVGWVPLVRISTGEKDLSCNLNRRVKGEDSKIIQYLVLSTVWIDLNNSGGTFSPFQFVNNNIVLLVNNKFYIYLPAKCNKADDSTIVTEGNFKLFLPFFGRQD